MKRLAALMLCLSSIPLHAGNLSIYWLNNLAVQYEGTGYRETQSGWELKVKPQSVGQGVRWRGERIQIQAWRNNDYFCWEDGNSVSPLVRQTGQTRLTFRTIQADVRLPLAGSSVEATGGLILTDADFNRKDVMYGGVVVAGAREHLSAVGPSMGVHASTVRSVGRWALWADGEISMVRFLWSRNRLETNGGSIARGGFAYTMRGEIGLKRGAWSVSVGVVRQMHEILVPGGRGFSNGAAASLPINKIDFESPFISLSRDLP
jgi:hypothetical protein